MTTNIENQAVQPQMITMLTMLIGNQRIALSSDEIREILDPVAETRVPGAGFFSNTVVNVRGSVLPVAKIHDTISVDQVEPSAANRLVVVDVKMGAITVTTALFADGVQDVQFIEQNQICTLKDTGHTWPPEFVKGIFKDKIGFVMIPDLERIFAANMRN
jgi:purine-binding chemotaxis protein CheW